MREYLGFTLLELLVILAVLAIATTLAVPGFKMIVKTNRRVAHTNALVRFLRVARSQAITRDAYVAVCASTDGKQCDKGGQDWSAGWLAFINRDRDYPPRRDADERILAVHAQLKGEHLRSNRYAYTFRPAGKRSTNGTFVLCTFAESARQAVIVSYTGRVRVGEPNPASEPRNCANRRGAARRQARNPAGVDGYDGHAKGIRARS